MVLKTWRSFLYAGCAIFVVIILGAVMIMPVNAGSAQGGDHQKIMSDVLSAPQKAIISPHGGRLEIGHEAEIQLVNGQPELSFVIPADASELRLIVPGHTIARWSSQPVILEPSSGNASHRTLIESRRDELVAELEAVKARLAVWQTQTGEASSQELASRQNMMQSEIPVLAARQEELQRRLTLVERELSELPPHAGVGQRIQVTLTQASADKKQARVDYSYNLSMCGWQAVYDFNARPDNGSGDMVEVRLLAEVWQYTGMDWKNTEIVLATLGSGPREPAPLQRWVVGAAQPSPRPEPRAAAYNARAKAAAGREATADSSAVVLAAAPPAAPVVSNADAIYANWTLSAKGLPEGRSRVEISTDVWKAPLQWLARPTTNDNRVWLLAKYNLPVQQAWPAGTAQFSVDNQSVGDGAFNPDGREATLYFGADPRVNVRTTIDTNRQGESGFINTSKTWTGAWTYTISNEHSKSIQVKVERPAPVVANENITVTYKDQPPSQKDDKEHMVYWDVNVPAHGKTSIEHSVTISSPEKLPLFPAVP